MASATHFRKEIDGLRTIAVAAVVLYHLKIPLGDGYFLPGGFLGVDVFFVISGFLITRIILTELSETGRFNLWQFYLRRARRILPALVVVILASMITAYFVLLPSEMDRFAISIVAALGFFSNIFWFIELGQYGGQSGLLQPLLHTWSLAIEEQFYIVFPLLLMLLPQNRPRLLAATLAALLLLSLLLAQVTTMWDQELSFFSPVSRAWELLVGALLAYRSIHASDAEDRPGWLLWAAPKVAVLVLLASMALVQLPEVAHPGLVTLPTVLATAILVAYARPNEAVTRFLSLRPMTYVGKLSYGLYLWHFPIFAFGRLSSIDPPDLYDMVAWVGLAVLCSAVTYHLVETRFRFRVSGRNFAAMLAVSLSVMTAFVVTVRTTDLLDGARTDELASLYGDNLFDNAALRDLSWGPLDALAPNEEIGPWNAHRPSEAKRNVLAFDDPTATNVLIIGNSHSKDMFNALHLNADAFPGLQFARFGIATGFPQTQLDQLYASENFAQADVVMIASRYARQDLEVLPQVIESLQARGMRVIVVGNTAEFVSAGTLPVFDWYVQRYQGVPEPFALNQFAFTAEAQEPLRRNDELQQIVERLGATFLSRRDLVCENEAQECILVTPDGRKTMYDYGHWTIEGAVHFGQRALQRGWLDILRETPA